MSFFLSSLAAKGKSTCWVGKKTLSGENLLVIHFSYLGICVLKKRKQKPKNFFNLHQQEICVGGRRKTNNYKERLKLVISINASGWYTLKVYFHDHLAIKQICISFRFVSPWSDVLCLLHRRCEAPRVVNWFYIFSDFYRKTFNHKIFLCEVIWFQYLRNSFRILLSF